MQADFVAYNSTMARCVKYAAHFGSSQPRLQSTKVIFRPIFKVPFAVYSIIVSPPNKLLKFFINLFGADDGL